MSSNPDSSSSEDLEVPMLTQPEDVKTPPFIPQESGMTWEIPSSSSSLSSSASDMESNCDKYNLDSDISNDNTTTDNSFNDDVSNSDSDSDIRPSCHKRKKLNSTNHSNSIYPFETFNFIREIRNREMSGHNRHLRYHFDRLQSRGNRVHQSFRSSEHGMFPQFYVCGDDTRCRFSDSKPKQAPPANKSAADLSRGESIMSEDNKEENDMNNFNGAQSSDSSSSEEESDGLDYRERYNDRLSSMTGFAEWMNVYRLVSGRRGDLEDNSDNDDRVRSNFVAHLPGNASEDEVDERRVNSNDSSSSSDETVPDEFGNAAQRLAYAVNNDSAMADASETFAVTLAPLNSHIAASAQHFADTLNNIEDVYPVLSSLPKENEAPSSTNLDSEASSSKENDCKPCGSKSIDSISKNTDSEPSGSKNSDSETSNSKISDSKPSGSKSTDSKPSGSKSLLTELGRSKIFDSEPTSSKNIFSDSSNSKILDFEPFQMKSSISKPSCSKYIDCEPLSIDNSNSDITKAKIANLKCELKSLSFPNTKSCDEKMITGDTNRSTSEDSLTNLTGYIKYKDDFEESSQHEGDEDGEGEDDSNDSFSVDSLGNLVRITCDRLNEERDEPTVPLVQREETVPHSPIDAVDIDMTGAADIDVPIDAADADRMEGLSCRSMGYERMSICDETPLNQSQRIRNEFKGNIVFTKKETKFESELPMMNDLRFRHVVPLNFDLPDQHNDKCNCFDSTFDKKTNGIDLPNNDKKKSYKLPVNYQLGCTPRSFQTRCMSSLSMVKRLQSSHMLVGHKGCVNAVSFNRKGDLLATGSDDRCIRLWRWQYPDNQKNILFEYKTPHRRNIFQTKFMPYCDNTRIVTCSQDGDVRYTEISTLGPMCVLLGKHEFGCHKLGIKDSANELYSCGEDGQVFSYDIRKPNPQMALIPHENSKMNSFFSIDVNPTNEHIFVLGCRDAYIRIYDERYIKKSDLKDDKATLAKLIPYDSRFKIKFTYCTCAVYSKDGSEIVATFKGSDIFLFNVNDRINRRYFGHLNNETTKGVNFYGGNSEYIVSGSDCGHIFIWDKRTRKIVQCFKGDKDGIVNVLEPHPSLPVLATGGLDHQVKIWQPTTNRECATNFYATKKLITLNSKGGLARGNTLFDFFRFNFF